MKFSIYRYELRNDTIDFAKELHYTLYTQINILSVLRTHVTERSVIL